jgi:GNAT superfamily N-acetyltransferase
MRIRPADLADIEAIVALDHGYTTDHVWQMSSQGGTGEHGAVFRLVKLPRQIQVPPAHDERNLRRCLHRCEYVWVMEGGASHEIVGYAGLATVPWQGTGWVPVMGVKQDARRKGVGTQLLLAAIAQARAAGLHSVTVDVQTKNYPATRLCHVNGLRFSGFADNYYAGRDIALFFAYRIR